MSSSFNAQVRLFHHHCRQPARLPVLILYVEKTDYTEPFYHSNEVLTLMLVLRLKVIFHSHQCQNVDMSFQQSDGFAMTFGADIQSVQRMNPTDTSDFLFGLTSRSKLSLHIQ